MTNEKSDSNDQDIVKKDIIKNFHSSFNSNSGASEATNSNNSYSGNDHSNKTVKVDLLTAISPKLFSSFLKIEELVCKFLVNDLPDDLQLKLKESCKTDQEIYDFRLSLFKDAFRELFPDVDLETSPLWAFIISMFSGAGMVTMSILDTKRTYFATIEQKKAV